MQIIDFKGTIPFRQQFIVEGTVFKMEFYYRKIDDTILCDLYDENDNLLSGLNPIRFKQPLFSHMIPDINGNIRKDFPQKLLVSMSTTGASERVGIDTLFKTVFITLQPANWYTPATGMIL